MAGSKSKRNTGKPFFVWFAFVTVSISATLFVRSFFTAIINKVILFALESAHNHEGSFLFFANILLSLFLLILALAFCSCLIAQVVAVLRRTNKLYIKTTEVTNKLKKVGLYLVLLLPISVMLIGPAYIVVPQWFLSEASGASFHIITITVAFLLTIVPAYLMQKWCKKKLIGSLMLSFVTICSALQMDYGVTIIPIWSIVVACLVILFSILVMRFTSCLCIDIPQAVKSFASSTENKVIHKSSTASAFKMVYFLVFLGAASGLLVDVFMPFASTVSGVAAKMYSDSGSNTTVSKLVCGFFSLAVVFHIMRLYMSLELLEYSKSIYARKLKSIKKCWARISEYIIRGSIIIVVSLKLVNVFDAKEISGLGFFMITLYISLLSWDVLVKFAGNGKFDYRLLFPSIAGLVCGIIIFFTGLMTNGPEEQLVIILITFSGYACLVFAYVGSDTETFEAYCRYISSELAFVCSPVIPKVKKNKVI